MTQSIDDPQTYLASVGVEIITYDAISGEEGTTQLVYDFGGQRRRFKLKPENGIALSRDEAMQRFARRVFLNQLASTAKARERESQHIGELGKRYSFTGQIVFFKTFKRKIEDEEHDAYLTLVRTDGGNLVKYWNAMHFGKGESKVELGIGVRLAFNATVSEHDEYKGEKQTVVQRAYVTAIHENQNQG